MTPQMDRDGKKMLTVQATVGAPMEQVWECWTNPAHITQWTFASEDWHAPWAENDFRVGGKFTTRMEAKDGSFGFDFWGTYDEIVPHARIAYTMGDGRVVRVAFEQAPDGVSVKEEFEAEEMSPLEMQQAGWQAILNMFRRYVMGRDEG
jgi:uncharacterized protein YndB with AHSA1/START domain